MTVDGEGGIDNLLHTLADAADIVERHGMADVEVDIVAVGHGDVDGHLGTLVEVVDGLAQDEEQRTRVGTQAAGRLHVEKLDGLGVIHPVVHALHLVVHLGHHRTMRQMVQLPHRHSLRDAQGESDRVVC